MVTYHDLDLPVAAIQKLIQVGDQTGKKHSAYINPPVCSKNLSSRPLKAFKPLPELYPQASDSNFQQLYSQSCINNLATSNLNLRLNNLQQ